jgi:hypothetical protein
MMWLLIPWALGATAVFCLVTAFFGSKDSAVNGVEVLIGMMIATTWPVSLPSLGLFVLLIGVFCGDVPNPIRLKPRS